MLPWGDHGRKARHDSAPDIYGKRVANPIEQIARAIEKVLKEGPRTREIGGKAGTEEVGKAIAGAVRTP